MFCGWTLVTAQNCARVGAGSLAQEQDGAPRAQAPCAWGRGQGNEVCEHSNALARGADPDESRQVHLSDPAG